MTTRTLVAWCAVAFVHVFAATGVHAQCGSGYIGLVQMLSRDSVAIVFVGTATSVERVGSTEAVTFDAERVWKGPVNERTTIYRTIPVRIGNAEFSPAMFERGNLTS
jgi:hypothetical protein